MITLVHHYLLQECEQPLTAVKELISNQTGIPISRQLLIITEIKKPVQGLGSVVKKMTCAWQGRQGIYSLILSLVNFALLPQAVSRYIPAWPITPSNAFSGQDHVASSVNLSHPHVLCAGLVRSGHSAQVCTHFLQCPASQLLHPYAEQFIQCK